MRTLKPERVHIAYLIGYDWGQQHRENGRPFSSHAYAAAEYRNPQAGGAWTSWELTRMLRSLAAQERVQCGYYDGRHGQPSRADGEGGTCDE